MRQNMQLWLLAIQLSEDFVHQLPCGCVLVQAIPGLNTTFRIIKDGQGKAIEKACRRDALGTRTPRCRFVCLSSLLLRQ